MSKIKYVATTALLVLGLAPSARADCVFAPFSFLPERNDDVQVEVQTDDKSFCNNAFREGPGYRFTDIHWIKTPRHGVLAATVKNQFAYHSFPDFRGADDYVIRACARVGSLKGCSTLIYNVTVQ